MQYCSKYFIILCLTGTGLASPALAQQEAVPPAVQALLDNIERGTTIKPAYDSLTNDGGTVTITNLALNKAASGDEPSLAMKIAKTELSGLSEEGDGLHQIGNATFSDMTMDIVGPQGTIKFATPEATTEGWYVQALAGAATPEQQNRAGMTIARRMNMGKATIDGMGHSFTIDGYEASWDGDPKTGAGKFESRLINIAVPQSAVAMMDQGGILKQLGYSSLSFDLMGKGDTTIADGALSGSFEGSVTGRDMGTIRIAGAGTGLPLSVLAELQKSRAGGPEPDFNALLPQMQNTALTSLSLRFEDASITRKVLPMIAAMQGMDEKALIASAGPMLQMGLMQLQNQTFAEQTAKAVNSFLNDPKSLTVSASPPAPVKVSEFMTMNPNAPGEAITKLGLSVTAND